MIDNRDASWQLSVNLRISYEAARQKEIFYPRLKTWNSADDLTFLATRFLILP